MALSNSINLAKAISDGSRGSITADMGCGSKASRAFSVDWDYELSHGDPSAALVTKNEHASQENINAGSGNCPMTVEVLSASGEDVIVDSLSAFMSKGKIKVTDHSIKFDKIIKMKLRFGYDRTSPPEIGLTVPKVKSGTYNFIAVVKNNDELQSYYITKIKISK